VVDVVDLRQIPGQRRSYLFYAEETPVPRRRREQRLPLHQLLLVAGVDRTEPGNGAVAEGDRHGNHVRGETLAGCGHDLLQHPWDG